jgi:chemotaxis protein MotB
MRINKLLVGAVSGALLVGVILGFVLRPTLSPDKRIGELETKVAEAEKAAGAQKQRADGLDKDLDKLGATKKDLEEKLKTAQQAEAKLADSAADVEQRKKDAAAVQTKLKTAAGGAGTAFVNGEDVHLSIGSGSLFKGATDELTPAGMKVLDKVALAIKDKELAGRRVAIHGHSNAAAPPQPPAPKPAPAPAAKLKKGQKPAPPIVPVVKRVTNWEVSAERAVAVVRYLQEKGKLDSNRLTLEAFGPYRPRGGRATARIEIVVSPKPTAKR